MSNRRRASATRHATECNSALDAMAGLRIPGGCDDCTAYQTMTSEADGLYELLVHHDVTCPFYRGLERK